MAQKKSPRCLPEWWRKRGIATQKELVLALLPYFEWYPRQMLLANFIKTLPHTETAPKKSSTFDRHMVELIRKGLIERKYGEYPPCPANSPNAKPHRYVYYRRLTRTGPPVSKFKKSLLRGTYGKAQNKQQKPKRRRHKTTNTHLTLYDVDFIQCNKYDMSIGQLSEMFNICRSTTWRILNRKAYPRHLRTHVNKSLYRM